MSSPRSPPDAERWSEALFQALTRHSGDIISLLDSEGRLLFNSAAAERISGFALEELAGVDTFQFIHPDDREAVGRAFREVLAAPGASVTVQYRYRHKSGGWTWMEAVASNHLDDPEICGVVTNSRDVGERRAMEARLARAKVEGLGRLVGGVAHDFNNLLVGIVGAADLARSELPAGHAALEPLRTVVDASNRAAALCRQLLALAGRAQPSLGPVPLDALLGETADLLGISAGRRLVLRREVAPGLPAVLGDAGQLRQLLLNLVVNAAEASEGGGQVTLRADRVEADRALLDTFRLGEGLAPGWWIRLKVTDDGSGMTPQVLARVFDPFFTTKEEGRGLGLAETLGIVRRHRGCVRVESAPGRGTTFTILLPPAEGTPVSPSPWVRDGGWRGQGLALVVDDEELVRRVARRMLERAGFRVEEACDGVAGAEAVEREPGRYAVVLLDLTMPRLDGAGALARIRKAAPGLPVVLASGHAREERRASLEALGVSAFLEKPFDATTFGAAIERACQGASHRPGSRGG
jgi:PAS domain S-box-containing protein